MKAKYLVIGLVMLGIVLACNIGGSPPDPAVQEAAVQTAIAETEAARPRPTNTPLPPDTPSPTDTLQPPPASNPRTSANVPALEGVIASVADLNIIAELYRPEIVDITEFYMQLPCPLNCAGREYTLINGGHKLSIQIAEHASAEIVEGLVDDAAIIFGGEGMTFLAISEGAYLEEISVDVLLDRSVLPENLLILQIDEYYYYAIASYGPILIEIDLHNQDNPIDAEMASFYLTHAMSMQWLNLEIALME